MSDAWYLFAGGGTGGHLFPGIAVADALRQRDPQCRVTFLTTLRGLDRDLLSRTPYEQIPQPVKPFSMKPWDWPRFWFSWRRSVRQARRMIRRCRPRAVLGLGGYAAGPAVVAARAEGVRTAILNPDAIPGRANRYLARFADLVVLQWDASRRCFGVDAHCETWGSPIRAAFAAADAQRGRVLFDLDPKRPVLLVTGASQGARTVNRAVCRIWPEFSAAHPEWQLLHLSGAADEREVREAHESRRAAARVVGFTHEMHHAIATADALVSRAGASTLAELTAIGRPSVLLPYPYHRDRHQHANAQVLADAGAAILVEDRKDERLNAEPLRAALEQIADADHRDRMRSAAARLGRPDAAQRVAEWLRAGRDLVEA